ncbi:MAG TPA: chromosomal replication initiator protein DnaA [Erysipelotrichaceae bacterium]|nr:chromosomal replication initiator protein DnaA [Erysipelotrichaceae bacterium]
MNTSISEMARVWQQTLKIIDKRLNERHIFDSFFANTYINDVSGDVVTIIVDSLTSERLLSSKYVEIIKEALNDVTEHNYNLVFKQLSEIKKVNLKQKNKKVEESLFFKDAKINTSLTFDSFVEGSFNKEACRAAKMISKNPGKVFNPLFIYSNSGLGKTHLLHAIGNQIKNVTKPGAKVLYIDANDFVDEYVKFVKGEKESESIKDFFSTVDVLLFDDVQFLENKVKTEEMFFYVYQKMVNSNKQIVITSDRQPSELKGLEDRLITRFSQGLTTKINSPDIATCIKILEKQIEKVELDIKNFDPAVLNFYAEKFSSNVRELEGSFNRLIFYITQIKQVDKVTLDIAIEAVQSITGTKNAATQLSEHKIINIVSNYYNLTPSQLVGKLRTGQIVLARHIAMYLIRLNLDVSLTKIGNTFGGRDHTTVMNGVLKVEKMLKNNTALKEAIDNLQKRLKTN